MQGSYNLLRNYESEDLFQHLYILAFPADGEMMQKKIWGQQAPYF